MYPLSLSDSPPPFNLWKVSLQYTCTIVYAETLRLTTFHTEILGRTLFRHAQVMNLTKMTYFPLNICHWDQCPSPIVGCSIFQDNCTSYVQCTMYIHVRTYDIILMAHIISPHIFVKSESLVSGDYLSHLSGCVC